MPLFHFIARYFSVRTPSATHLYDQDNFESDDVPVSVVVFPGDGAEKFQ